MGLLNDCPICYKQDISQCVDTIVFALDLTPDTTYLFTFTDNHGKEHIVSGVADASGNVTINVSDLPDGFFIVYSGVKTVTFKEQGGCDNLCFTPCSGSYYSTTDSDITEYCCITLRPVDRNDESYVDDIVETIPCCGGEATESIVLSADYACSETASDTGVVSGDFDVRNGSGNYALQFYSGGNWIAVESNVSNPFAFEIKSPTNTDTSVRVIDMDTLIASNEVSLHITACSDNQVLKLTDTYFECNGINGELSVFYTITNHNGTGISVQYYDGTTWNELAVIPAPIDDGDYTQEGISFNPSTGNYPIRLVSGASISNTVSVAVTHCGSQSTITLLQVGNQGSSVSGTTISIDYLAINAYELTFGNKDLIIQYSPDGLGGWTNNQTIDMPSSPFTGHPAIVNRTSPVYAPLVFVRLYGNDSEGVPIYSNALPIPP